MSDWVLDPGPRPSLPVAGQSGRFAVRRVFCVGRNYADHAREMGGDPDREPPFFFMKSPTDLLESGGELPYPPGTENLHHEVELVIALGASVAAGASEAEVRDAIYGYAVGIDMTRRDLQAAAKKKGRPWVFGKSFEGAAVCSPLAPASAVGHPRAAAITLDVNGERRQSSGLDHMTWAVDEVVQQLAGFYRLAAGDLIYTGTPAGVGAVVPGDVLSGAVAGVGEVRVTIGAR